MNVKEYRKFYNKCERCTSCVDLIVHHKDKNRKNNTKENFEVLCTSCHAIIHKRITNIIRMRRFYITHKEQMVFDFYRCKAALQ